MTGRGRFGDDIPADGCLHAVFLRSPWPHATIVRIGTDAASTMPGVAVVLTATDAISDRLGDLPCQARDSSRFRDLITPAPRPILARDTVRFVGDPVAVVIAETRQQAENAAEHIQIDYHALPSVTDIERGAEATAIWGAAPENLAFRVVTGDGGAVDHAFAAATHCVALDLSISRVIAAPIEPRSAIGFCDPATGCLRLVTGTQSPHLLRSHLARHVFSIPEEMLRIESPDVGGSFGVKNAVYPELAVVLWAARRLGRPVHWLSTRSESFLGDDHARDNLWRVELAFDDGGLIIGLRAHLRANLGAYLSTFGTHCPLNNLFGLVGPYAIPAASVTVEGYYTNTTPVAAYRGAGRPEACYAVERTLDVAALRLGVDRIELRRKNLVSPAKMPWSSALGAVFDSGDFPENLRLALEASRWDEFPQRRKRSAEKGRLRGIGLANHIESAGSTVEEMAEVKFDPDGSATVFVGTPPQGQGHETMLRQFVYELMGIDPARVRVVHSDTDAVFHGQGTFGSRAASVTSAALVGVVEKLREKAAPLAAELLGSSLGDLEFSAGQFRSRRTNHVVSLADVAAASFSQHRPGLERGLAARHIWRPDAQAFPSGCHVCELEIDPETGSIEIVNYVAVEDCGRIVNPTLLAGQIQGGVLQGVGQALMECIVYDASGQLITGSFMDYAMPRADNFASLRLIDNSHPTSTNPLGIKGAGESGTVGSLPAVMNAVTDALKLFGVEHLDMPASPQRVWSAMRKFVEERTAAAYRQAP